MSLGGLDAPDRECGRRGARQDPCAVVTTSPAVLLGEEALDVSLVDEELVSADGSGDGVLEAQRPGLECAATRAGVEQVPGPTSGRVGGRGIGAGEKRVGLFEADRLLRPAQRVKDRRQ